MASSNANAELLRFSSATLMAHCIADLVENALGRAIAERGHAQIALSGGSTPAELYETLSERSLLWQHVHATLVDERWASPSSHGSNENFARRTLQRGRAHSLHFLGLWSNTPTPTDGLAEAEKKLQSIPHPFDVVILGLGNDGHTASWFPHAEGLTQALQLHGPLLASIRAQPSDVTGEYLDRMTLTLGAISAAKQICLLMRGNSKLSAFENALKPGPIEEMPIRALLHTRPDAWYCWAP